MYSNFIILLDEDQSCHCIPLYYVYIHADIYIYVYSTIYIMYIYMQIHMYIYICQPLPALFNRNGLLHSQLCEMLRCCSCHVTPMPGPNMLFGSIQDTLARFARSSEWTFPTLLRVVIVFSAFMILKWQKRHDLSSITMV